jgi:hypothetical protein
VFGKSSVEIAPYDVVERDGAIEVRHYDELLLVTTPLPGGMGGDRSAAFGRLFDYISGSNVAARKISMTAPVFMQEPGEGEEIAMTAPVLMDESGPRPSMSFVLPSSYTLDSAPRPTDPNVRLRRLADYDVAAIRFAWWLSESNVRKHRQSLLEWIAERGYRASGPALAAGYNPPWTLPMFRRNEVLVPVER